MNIRLKLTLGIGLLFGFVVLLSLTGILQVNRLSNDTRNILRANYNTLDYTRAMLSALDKIPGDSMALHRFASNLKQQERNVTEPGEAEATADLAGHFALLRQRPGDSTLPFLVRKDIHAIMQLNMTAINQKSKIAEDTAGNATVWITVAGTVSCILAFVLLLSLPGSIADPVRELTGSIEAIAAQNYSQRVHFKGDDELVKLSSAFNIMAEKLEEYHNSNLAGLLMEKKRIDTLINNMQDPVIGLDEHNRILFANNEALSITGLQLEQVTGKPVQDIALHNDLVRLLVRDLISPVHEGAGHNPGTLKIFAHGKESYFEQETVRISVTPTGEKQQRYIGHVILLKNVTPFKELDAAKTNFIATVSHELKTPIASIKMSLQLLQGKGHGPVSEEQAQLLGSIEEDSNRLLKITGELLNITQAETGNIQLNMQRTRPEEIVTYATGAAGFLAERKNIMLVQEVVKGLPDVYADADKTAWVLINFLTNAIRYSPEGARIVLSVSAEEGKVRFLVRDSGKGIEQRYLDKLFDRYFQVPDKERDGSGLGLAISKEFIEAQGGTIGVQSEPGAGSSFYFTI